MSINNWFETWFDSPYYHKLYFERNDKEAQVFINNLMQYLKLPQESLLLDVACGKGRHSNYLASQGYKVTGTDLSPNSIQQANAHAVNNAQFYIHDMRLPFKEKVFTGVFNFFTSFGYFDDDADNQKALNAMQTSLIDGGYLVLDFLNQQYVKNHLVPNEEKNIDGTLYQIKKWVDDKYFYKQITITDKTISSPMLHTEKVARITKEQFLNYFKNANLKIDNIFGNYSLFAFDEITSPRIIIIAKK